MEKHLQSEEVGTNPEPFLDWFCCQYPNRAEALWKAKRLWYAMMRMNEILRSYSEEFKGLSTAEEGFGLVSVHIVNAFWRLYSAIPDGQLEGYAPSVAVVQKLAFESKGALPPWFM
jgi:hypothetical protein